MKLKHIEDGMLVHCKTEDEAKELIKWAYECGYEWNTGSREDTFFDVSSNIVLSSRHYLFEENTIRLPLEYNKERMTMIEFSALIIAEEQDEEHMGAEEIIEWLSKHYEDGTYAEVFGEDYLMGALLSVFTPKEIISKIEAYEREKKEPEVEWVWRVYGAENYGEKFFDTEEQAIARCEELAKTQKTKQYARYEKVCRAKEK